MYLKGSISFWISFSTKKKKKSPKTRTSKTMLITSSSANKFFSGNFEEGLWPLLFASLLFSTTKKKFVEWEGFLWTLQNFAKEFEKYFGFPHFVLSRSQIKFSWNRALIRNNMQIIRKKILIQSINSPCGKNLIIEFPEMFNSICKK